MNRFLRFLVGIGAGAAAGYLVGLLLSPESGEENVRRVRGWVDGAIAEGRQAADQRQRDLEAELNEASQRPQA